MVLAVAQSDENIGFQHIFGLLLVGSVGSLGSLRSLGPLGSLRSPGAFGSLIF